MKQGITRLGGSKFKIDVLQCEKEIAAGTFSDVDIKTLERHLPGLYDSIRTRTKTAPEQTARTKP